MKKIICLLLLTALLLVGCGTKTEAPANSGSTEPTGTSTNYPFAPNFTVYNEKNQPVKLSDYDGRPVVLNFWASWCGPCQSEMPEFQKAFETYGEGVQFLMVDVGEPMKDGQAFIGSTSYTFPVFFDTRSEAATAYQISAIPATYFINADGRIVGSYVGAISESDLLAGIAAIQN